MKGSKLCKKRSSYAFLLLHLFLNMSIFLPRIISPLCTTDFVSRSDSSWKPLLFFLGRGKKDQVKTDRVSSSERTAGLVQPAR